MADPIVTPMLIGAGVGALGGLVTGNDPLKTAALGATVGAGGYGAGLWGTGAAGGASAGATAATSAVPNLAANAAPVTLGSSATIPTAADIGAGFGYSTGLGSTASYLPAQQAAGYAASANAIPVAGQSLNPYTGMYDDLSGISESYIDKGLIGSTNFNPVANIGASSQQTPFFGGNEIIKNVGIPEPTMWDKISPYMNVRDLGGAAQIASQFQQRPQVAQAPSGGISRGQAPQGTDVMALLQSIKQPERKRISLL